ncbi:unnamed protein product [Rotaria sordida]|uniref:Alpha-L-fucosidase n=1 Tax=Rotaria sordida TaxID=392033 RepID=A0A814HCS5_9BILA|nr:unnamed protein product [Rotaria sordida]CAF1357136.1 unnamed protein product [Rotaria sordida]
MLKEIVITISTGGNALINVGPNMYGKISPIFQERLRQMGSWLQVNGEAIYATKPWKYQNDTINPNVWYTSSKDNKFVYAFLLIWPKDSNEIILGAPLSSPRTIVTLLGSTADSVPWNITSGDRGIVIDVSAIKLHLLQKYGIFNRSHLNNSSIDHHFETFSNHNHSSIRKTRSKSIIHATIRPLRISHPINNNSIQRNNNKLFSISNIINTDDYRDQSENSSIIQKSSEFQTNSMNFVNVNKIHRHFLLQPQRKNVWLDNFNTTNDHHQDSKNNQKKLYSKQCLAALIISILLVIAVIITTLLIFLIKPQTTSTSTSSTKVAVLRWNTSGITIAGITTMSGNTSNQLNQPWDLALDWSNALYVTDQRNNRVQKFLMDISTGTTVAGQANTTGGLTLNYLRGPLGIIVDENSNIYVSDNNNDRIVFWSNGATSGSLFAGNGTTGNSINQLDDPYGLAHDPNSDAIYIADYNNHRIMRYFQNNSSGTLVAGGNGNGKNQTQLSLPTAIYFDSLSNSLLIVNTGAHNIVRWVLGESSWTLVAGNINGTAGISSMHLKSPTDVTLDPMGNMYVADRNNQRIQFYLVGETNGTTIAGRTGITGSNSTLFDTPSSIILDNQLNLYVVDRFNHRIQKFLRY